MNFMNKPVYSLLESSLPMGGIKVKLDGNTCAQFPTLEKAINYLHLILKRNSQDYKVIEFTKKDGAVETIQLFD